MKRPNNITSLREGRKDIRVDDLNRPEVEKLLLEHIRCMSEVSTPESRHVLSIEALRQPDITFWTVWDGVELMGCGASRS